ncbi:hypothetical protein FHG87_006814 [Trinorchestia longiramus]|nr:hypothetical protein FHG87_006814 [Trinorchestia longiramus]
MEAVYRAWNTNFFGTRNRSCEVLKSDVKRGEIDRIVLEYSIDSRKVVVEDDGLKINTEPHGIAGSAVLLWLPPPVSASQTKCPLLDENNGCVSFINIYPSSSNGLKNQLYLNGGCKMDQRSLVNLISNGHTPLLGALPNGSLVTVHDVAVPTELLVSLNSQAEIDCFCQNIIENLSSTIAKQQNSSNEKTNFSVVFQVQKEGWYADILSKILCSDYSNEKLKSGKLGNKIQKKSKFDAGGLRCNHTEKTDVTVADLTVVGIHTYYAGYVSPIVKTLTNLEHEKNCPKSLFYLAGKALDDEVAGFCIDFRNCLIPDFHLMVKNGNLLLSIDSHSPLCLSIELPANLKLDHEGNLCHWNINNILYFIARVQFHQQEQSLKIHTKKLLDHSASVDSGIGNDEFHCKNWLSLEMLEVEMDDVFGECDGSLNTDEFLELFGQKLLGNSIFLQSDILDSLKTSHTCAIADQKPICDTNAPVNETKLRKHNVACSPNFEISQTLEKVHIAISCSNLQRESMEIYGESDTMIGISFSEVDCAVRQHVYISSVDPSCPDSLGKTTNNFGFEDSKNSNSEIMNVLKNVVVCPEKVLVSLMKSTPATWDTVWAGAKGRLAKIILSTRAQSQPKLVKNAEPLRIEQQPTAKTEPENLIPANDSQHENNESQTVKGVHDIDEVSDTFKESTPETPSLNNSDQKVVNVNKKKRLGALIVPVQITNGDDAERTTDCEVSDNEAVKISASPLENEEKGELEENEHKKSSSVKGFSKCTETNSNRYRRSSECVIDGSVSDGRKSYAYKPRSILKRRGRSYSESHVGSLEECLGEELLGKYGSVEKALVVEYGCFEGLREECGWDEEEDDEAFGRSEELDSSVGSKKNVRFNDVSRTHLFMSKASILNQIANDDKKAMRMKMKESKKKQRSEKRMAQRSGSVSGSPRRSFDSSYRGNSGYGSHDEGITTEESDGGELVTSSSGETTDNTTTEEETDNEKPTSGKAIMEPSVLVPSKKNKKLTGRKRGGKCNKKRVELTNNMIFQLDMDA